MKAVNKTWKNQVRPGRRPEFILVTLIKGKRKKKEKPKKYLFRTPIVERVMQTESCFG